MPTPNRQPPKGQTKPANAVVKPTAVTRNGSVPLPAFPEGSILAEGIPVTDVKASYINIVIYGENRVGKTTLACQFPKPLALLALEPNETGGALSVNNVPGVTYYRFRDTAKAIGMARELAQWNPFKTIVIDSATSYQDIVLREILNLEMLPPILNWGMVSREQYRERSEKTRECLRPYVDLKCNTVILAKQKDHNANKDRPTIVRGRQAESFFAAALGGETVGWLHDTCDYIAQLFIDKEYETVDMQQGDTIVPMQQETGRTLRRLRTMLHPNYAAGFRSSTPEKVPEFIDEPTYEKIAAVIGGKT